MEARAGLVNSVSSFFCWAKSSIAMISLASSVCQLPFLSLGSLLYTDFPNVLSTASCDQDEDSGSGCSDHSRDSSCAVAAGFGCGRSDPESLPAD